MTPKEKAEELVDYYWLLDKITPALSKEQAIQCALNVVHEITNHHHQEQGLYRIDRYYWNEVKREIEKMNLKILKTKQNGQTTGKLYR